MSLNNSPINFDNQKTDPNPEECKQIKQMRLWSDEDKLMLICQAKKYPVLWDIRSINYRELNGRKTALAEIQAKFENRFTSIKIFKN